jgi:CheY-like chemotaxis protein
MNEAAIVLVVDDSPVDRRLASRLVEKQAGWSARVAGDGLEALAIMDGERPDIVVTDMLMPNMNGLELVDAVRSRHPAVPVVLMTAHGSEGTAVAALRRGAASYVPKRDLARELIRTLSEVLAVSRPERDEQRAFESLAELEARFLLDSEPASLAPVVHHLETLLARVGLGDETDRLQVAVALREALANAVEHGNLALDSEAKEQEGYAELLAARRREPGYSERRVELVVRIDRARAELVVTDEGAGFDPSALPDPTDPANLERAHGRGLMLIRTFMDEVRHNERGNAITMIKRRPPS